MINHFAKLLAFAALIVSTAGFPPPTADPFYHAPSNISLYHPGQVIRDREVSTIVNASSLSSSHQLFFRKTDTLDQAIGTVATFWVPIALSSPTKIFVTQLAEDADNLDCSPSWAFFSNNSANGERNTKESTQALQDGLLITWALDQGYYVVSTDAEGPSSSFLVGLTEGRAVLDAIRAVIASESLCNASVAMYGYSGAAHTTVWAATEAGKYAPELDIVGACNGGTIVDDRSSFIYENDGPGSWVAGTMLFGLANAYPALNATFNELLTPRGKHIAANLRSDTNCSNYADVFDYTSIFHGDILCNPVLGGVFARESLLMNVTPTLVPVPTFPRYEFHSASDEIVPYYAEAAYVTQQCDKGANIQFNTLHGLDHLETALAGLVGALQFVQQAFNGTTPKLACGSGGTVPALNSSTAVEVLGPSLAAELQVLASEVATLPP